MAEILIAVTVVALAFIPIMTTLSSANRGTVDVENEALAVGLATEAIEWVRAIGFRDWRAALGDGCKNLRLPGEVRTDAGGGSITVAEQKVVSFKADDGTTEIDYPESSNRFSREIVMSFVKDSSGEFRTLRALATVRWKHNVEGSPSRRVQMETLVYSGLP
jgi:type II secretory pathway pseudopilin PulG